MSRSLPYLPSFPNLRHLVLETDSISEVVGSLQGFLHLQTLELCCHYQSLGINCPVIDVTHLTTLRHLRVEGFAPDEMKVGPACKVHAVWDEAGNGITSAQEGWLQTPAWRNLGTQLAAFTYLSASDLSPIAMQSLRRILKLACDLELLRLMVPRLGSRRAPFVVLPDRCRGFARALNLVVRTSLGCWPKIEDLQPSWQSLSIRVKGLLMLDIPDASHLAQTLQGFSLQYEVVKGAVIVELAAASASIGRRVIVKQDPNIEGCRVHTQRCHKEIGEIDRVMYSNCHACFSCLLMDGHISQG